MPPPSRCLFISFLLSFLLLSLICSFLKSVRVSQSLRTNNTGKSTIGVESTIGADDYDDYYNADDEFAQPPPLQPLPGTTPTRLCLASLSMSTIESQISSAAIIPADGSFPLFLPTKIYIPGDVNMTITCTEYNVTTGEQLSSTETSLAVAPYRNKTLHTNFNPGYYSTPHNIKGGSHTNTYNTATTAPPYSHATILPTPCAIPADSWVAVLGDSVMRQMFVTLPRVAKLQKWATGLNSQCK